MTAAKILRLPWHVFGRGPDGYATLRKASSLSSESASRLERFGWGQAKSSEYRASLITNPAFWIEPLGGKVAITRVFDGGLDNADRGTLAFLTFLFDTHSYQRDLLPGLQTFLTNSDVWRIPTDAHDITTTAPVPERIELKNSKLAHAIKSKLEGPGPRRYLRLSVDAVSFGDMVWIIQSIPADAASRLRIAYRSLSTSIECDINVLDSESEESASGAGLNLAQTLPPLTSDPARRMTELRNPATHPGLPADSTLRTSGYDKNKKLSRNMTTRQFTALCILLGLNFILATVALWMTRSVAADTFALVDPKIAQIRKAQETSEAASLNALAERDATQKNSIVELTNSMERIAKAKTDQVEKRLGTTQEELTRQIRALEAAQSKLNSRLANKSVLSLLVELVARACAAIDTSRPATTPPKEAKR